MQFTSNMLTDGKCIFVFLGHISLIALFYAAVVTRMNIQGVPLRMQIIYVKWICLYSVIVTILSHFFWFASIVLNIGSLSLLYTSTFFIKRYANCVFPIEALCLCLRQISTF